MKQRFTGKRVLARGKYLSLVTRGGWECVERLHISGIVIIVPVTPDGRVVLIEQFRPAVQGYVVEFPAGLVGDIPGKRRESFVTAAKRELVEETGYSAKRMKFLTEGPPSAGLSREHITFYLATDLKKVGPGGGDGSEDIRVFEVPLRKAEAWIESRRKKGVFVDPKVYTGLYFLIHEPVSK
jgi:ADP-ribose pyrophosphatase